MIDYRLGDVLSGKADLAENHYIYVVRDGDTVLYIGKSVQPATRLEQHCHYITPSALGRAIQRHRPASDDWTYTLYHVLDCRDAVRYALHPWTVETFEMNLDTPKRQRLVIDDAETALIITLRPLLNIKDTDREPWSEGNHPDPGPSLFRRPVSEIALIKPRRPRRHA